MTKPTSHPLYRPDIDGLRALAVLLVVGYHAFPTQLKSGFIGVDVFFVISGYLISTIIFTNLSAGTFSFVNFYRRRINRIFPALSLVLISCLAFGWFALLPSEFKQLGQHLAGGAAFVSNFVLWRESGYFDSLAETKPLLHLWSLAIEEQFYILWPAILWLTFRFKQSWLVVIAIVLGLSFALNLTSVYADPSYTFYSPQTRFWELLIGAIVAYATLYGRYPQAFLRYQAALSNLLSLGALVIFAAAVWLINQNRVFPGAWALLPTLAAALFIAAGPQAWVNRTVLSRPLLVWLGLISYPLYLWHWPLLAFQRIIEGEAATLIARVITVALSVLLAWVTYRFVETPVRQNTRNRPYVLLLCVAMTIIGAAGLYTKARDGLNARHQINEQVASLKQYSETFDENPLCRESYPRFQGAYCFKSKPGEPTLQILGDSHANRLIMGLSQLTNENILHLSHHSCPQFLDLAVHVLSRTDVCAKFNLQALDVALNTESIKTVIMTFRGPLYVGSHGGTVSLVSNPKQQDVKTVISTVMRKTLDQLLARHKTIVFVFDNPEINFDIKTCVDARSVNAQPSNIRANCAVPRAQYDAHHREYRTLMQSILKDYPAVKIVDGAKVFCDTDYCYASKNGEVLYTDFDHLSLAGSTLVAKEIIHALQK